MTVIDNGVADAEDDIECENRAWIVETEQNATLLHCTVRLAHTEFQIDRSTTNLHFN